MLSPTEDIKTITDLKRHSLEIAEQIHKTGRPVIVTVNGKPDLFVGDIKDFDMYEDYQLKKLLEPSFAQAKAGKLSPFDETIKKVRKELLREKVRRQKHAAR